MKHKKNHPWAKPANAAATPANCSASTGPVTAEGKEVSSKNALKHGCSATGTLILPTENLADFKALEATWFRSYKPQDEAEVHLVHELVKADWFLQRSTGAYSDVETQTYNETGNAADWTEKQHSKLARFLRYRTAHANAFVKLRKAVDDYRRNRQMEQSREQVARHKDERIAISKARVEILAKKQSHSVEQELDRWLDAQRAAKEAEVGPGESLKPLTAAD